jgi:hypothetical protein
MKLTMRGKSWLNKQKGGFGRIFVQPAKQRRFIFNMTILKMQTPAGLNMIIPMIPKSEKSATSPNWQNRDRITSGGCNRKSGGLWVSIEWSIFCYICVELRSSPGRLECGFGSLPWPQIVQQELLMATEEREEYNVSL